MRMYYFQCFIIRVFMPKDDRRKKLAYHYKKTLGKLEQKEAREQMKTSMIVSSKVISDSETLPTITAIDAHSITSQQLSGLASKQTIDIERLDEVLIKDMILKYGISNLTFYHATFDSQKDQIFAQSHFNKFCTGPG